MQSALGGAAGQMTLFYLLYFFKLIPFFQEEFGSRIYFAKWFLKCQFETRSVEQQHRDLLC